MRAFAHFLTRKRFYRQPKVNYDRLDVVRLENFYAVGHIVHFVPPFENRHVNAAEFRHSAQHHDILSSIPAFVRNYQIAGHANVIFHKHSIFSSSTAVQKRNKVSENVSVSISKIPVRETIQIYNFPARNPNRRDNNTATNIEKKHFDPQNSTIAKYFDKNKINK